MNILFKKLHPDAQLPMHAKEGDAGVDLVATSLSFEGPLWVFGMGLAVQIPDGYVGLLFPRSSISKTEHTLTNCVGVVDSGYRGEIKMKFAPSGVAIGRAVQTDISESMDQVANVIGYAPLSTYQVGDRVGQLVIVPYVKIEGSFVNELSETERGSNGFGSSGA